jgi:Kef-type K+ transport system membrane component KefB
VGLLNDVTGWLVCLAIIGIATVDKLGSTAMSTRLTGMNWKDAFALGSLMNTRGLVELVALNIGYDLGILPPTIFTMMVLEPGDNLSYRSLAEFDRKGQTSRGAGNPCITT